MLSQHRNRDSKVRFPGQGKNVISQNQDKIRAKTSFPKITTGQDRVKTSFPKIRVKTLFPKIRVKTLFPKIGTKVTQTLCPNANSPLRVYDTKGWYCAKDTTWRPAAVTSVTIASKQEK